MYNAGSEPARPLKFQRRVFSFRSKPKHRDNPTPMTTALPQPLRTVRALSLALNLPGPSADPMGIYSPAAYATLHSGVRVVHAHLKTAEGQAALHEELTRTDVLITSFRPSALTKLGLSWEALQSKYPRLSLVRIVGAAAERAE